MVGQGLKKQVQAGLRELSDLVQPHQLSVMGSNLIFDLTEPSLILLTASRMVCAVHCSKQRSFLVLFAVTNDDGLGPTSNSTASPLLYCDGRHRSWVSNIRKEIRCRRMLAYA